MTHLDSIESLVLSCTSIVELLRRFEAADRVVLPVVDE
jgi:hypothetical protein